MLPELALMVMCGSVGLALAAAGYALAKVGTASMAMLSEKPEQFFKGFLVVTLCEAIGIYGLVLGLIILLEI